MLVFWFVVVGVIDWLVWWLFMVVAQFVAVGFGACIFGG